MLRAGLQGACRPASGKESDEDSNVRQSRIDTQRLPEQDEMIPESFSSLTEWVGIGFFVLLFAWVLAGIMMVLVHGVLLPPEAICLRG